MRFHHNLDTFFLSSISYITHPEGLHNLRPGGSSSRLLRGAIPAATCMMVMNFLYFILKVLWFFSVLQIYRGSQRHSTFPFNNCNVTTLLTKLSIISFKAVNSHFSIRPIICSSESVRLCGISQMPISFSSQDKRGTREREREKTTTTLGKASLLHNSGDLKHQSNENAVRGDNCGTKP